MGAEDVAAGKAKQVKGKINDVVGAVTFLASRAGAYVNGTIIPLDGGYIAAL